MTDVSEMPSSHVVDRQSAETAIGSKDPLQDLRIRAAWLYYVKGFTQKETALLLAINRVQVTRLLAEARKRGEVPHSN